MNSPRSTIFGVTYVGTAWPTPVFSTRSTAEMIASGPGSRVTGLNVMVSPDRTISRSWMPRQR